jgi:endonuclease/exonuclease/phosphatase family metal-dependent hydrolase
MNKFSKILRIISKTLIIIVIVLIAFFIGFMIYATYSDYNPAPVTALQVNRPALPLKADQTEFTLLTWNIGYCCLGKEMDFYYYGGKHMRPSEEEYEKYVNGVFNFLAGYDTVDFILLQEVDTNSRRSYYSNQASVMKDDLPLHASTFACNDKVGFIPMPATKPVGRVESGMMSFSRFVPDTSLRYSFPLSYAWPAGLFMPDRCFIMERFALPEGNELVIINTHNSAFDDAGVKRLYESWMLRSFMLAEYEKGNYVIAGGDWNQNPANYDYGSFHGNFRKNPNHLPATSDLFPQGWHWAFDPLYPTNRDISKPYEPGSTPTQTIDFFVTSPNIIIEQVSVVPTNFEYSDHQPVYLRVQLAGNAVKMNPSEYPNYVKSMQDSIKVLNDALEKCKGRSTSNEKKKDRFYLKK